MSKKILISKGATAGKASRRGAAPSASPRGPMAPVRISRLTDLNQTPAQPKQILKKGRPASASRAARPGAPQYPKSAANLYSGSEKSGSPAAWLIPAGILAVIAIIVIAFSMSSNSKPDPYYSQSTAAQTGAGKKSAGTDRSMKEWMEKNGPTDMAKARKARMKNRPVTVVNAPAQDSSE